MRNTDARKLAPNAQEALRRRAVCAYNVEGMKQLDIAKTLSVSKTSVCLWIKKAREHGENSLGANKKGPVPGSRTLLTVEQSAKIQKLIRDKHPEQLKLPFALWTRDAVMDLISREFGVKVSIRTAGNYLKAWGFTPQKPVRVAYEQNPAAVKDWLDNRYPAIAKRAKKEGAIIFWGDEMGLRSDHQVGRSYGLKGKTPAIPKTGKRFGCSMISAVTNQGHLCFQVYEGSFMVAVFTEFMDRLCKEAKRKVFLIVDGHPVHRANVLQPWLAENKSRIEIFHLPSYSPDLNPDELLNQDVKTNVSRHGRPKNVAQLKANLTEYLEDTKNDIQIVKNYFTEKHVAYAGPTHV